MLEWMINFLIISMIHVSKPKWATTVLVNFGGTQNKPS